MSDPTTQRTRESRPDPGALRLENGEDWHVIDDGDRYSSLRLIPWWRQDLLSRSKIIVVGAGALGNEVLKNLSLVGIGQTLVIDMDQIEAANLSRSVLFRDSDAGLPKAEVAAVRSRELNPHALVIPVHGDVTTDIGLGVFAEADLVIGCLDNREARLWVNRMCWRVGTPWVDAGIQEIQGVVKVFVPPDSACYECAMTSRDFELLNLRYSCPLLRRDEILAGKVPTAPTIASMMAALEVQEALKILHRMPVEGGVAHVYNGVGNQFYTTRLPRREECLSHETYPPAVRAPLRSTDTATSLFDFARQKLEGPLTIALDRELVTSIEWPQSGKNVEIKRVRSKVAHRETIDESGRPGIPVQTSTIEESSPLVAAALAELGIPAYDIVRVESPSGSLFVQLDADRDRFFS